MRLDLHIRNHRIFVYVDGIPYLSRKWVIQ